QLQQRRPITCEQFSGNRDVDVVCAYRSSFVRFRQVEGVHPSADEHDLVGIGRHLDNHSGKLLGSTRGHLRSLSSRLTSLAPSDSAGARRRRTSTSAASGPRTGKCARPRNSWTSEPTGLPFTTPAPKSAARP